MQKAVYEFISKQTSDPIVQWKTCAVSGEPFAIFQSDLDFYEKISPTFNGKKYAIPTPTLCPQERTRRRMAWRNERKLYRRKDDQGGKDQISMFSPDKTYRAYEDKERYGDTWNPLDYGVDFEPKRTFSQQYDELLKQVPLLSTLVINNQNCDYVSDIGNSKNCYLCFDGDFCEDCMYSSIMNNTKDTVDGLHIYHCEHTYNCTNCTQSYNLINCLECDRSNFLTNCSKCSGCEFCHTCTNLVNQKYCIENKQYSKEEYSALVAQRPFSYEYPQGLMRMSYTVKCEGAVGTNLYNTKNNVICYNMGDAENMRYCDMVTGADNCQDISSYGMDTHRSYESCIVGLHTHGAYFSFVTSGGVNNIYYSHSLIGSSNCFGCIGLRNKEYCILNKQYTKAEYEIKVSEIIEHIISTGERGEFLDPKINPFGYNETLAMEYFPLTREEALERGYKWQDNNYDPIIPKGAETREGDQISTDITTVTDDVLQKIFICEVSGRPFRIVKAELEFYRRHGIPLPRKHPDIRHLQRLAQTPGRNLYLRKCDKCNQEKLSMISEKIDAKVYCETCYNKEIYG